MADILKDANKFKLLGSVNKFNKTAIIEQRIQPKLLEYYKNHLIPKKVYEKINPVGSQRPRLYGLPKIHKLNTPLRSILSMVVLQLHFQFCITNSFTSVNQIHNISIDPNNLFFCYFDIVSLDKNVPLDETIVICTDTLYRSYLDPTPIPEPVFPKLMHTATKRLLFSFNKTMYL